MKKNYVTFTLSLFFFFAGISFIQAQDTPFLQFGGTVPAKDSTAKTSFISKIVKITKTPWLIQIGPDLVDDNDTRLKEFKIFDNRNYYPIHCSAEKRIKKGLGIQAVFSSETLNPHHFLSSDLNLKYSFLTSSIEDSKWFDPYSIIGFGYTYRDFPHGQHKNEGQDNSLNTNIGGGVNLWIFKNAGIYLQTVAKFATFKTKFQGSNYLHLSAGVVFKIGNSLQIAKPAETKVENPIVVPSTYIRSKEAEDAAKYLREILDK